MSQPWGVAAMEETSHSHEKHGSVARRVGESIKKSVVPESAAETKKRDEKLEQEHSVSQRERNAAFAPQHHVGGTNLTVDKGTHGGGRGMK